MLQPFFVFANNHDIVFFENIRWFLIKHLPKWATSIVIGHMPLDRKNAINRCRRMFNDLGFHWGSCEIGRLIGFGEDKYDWYYIVKYPTGIVWNTMVGGFTSLKKKISIQAYINLERCHTYDCPKEDEFVYCIDKEDIEWDG